MFGLFSTESSHEQDSSETKRRDCNKNKVKKKDRLAIEKKTIWRWEKMEKKTRLFWELRRKKSRIDSGHGNRKQNNTKNSYGSKENCESIQNLKKIDKN